MNNNKTLNLNTASYFINRLAFPYVSIWYTTGGTITKKNHPGLTKHNLRKVEITWLTVNRYKDMELQYIVTNIKEHFGQPYLLKHLDELNIISYAMGKKLYCATQPISSTGIKTTKFSMQCVSPLFI